MIYKMLPKLNQDDPQIYARIDDDGKCRLTCTEDHPEFKEWVKAGNTPLEPDPVPAPVLTKSEIELLREELKAVVEDIKKLKEK